MIKAHFKNYLVLLGCIVLWSCKHHSLSESDDVQTVFEDTLPTTSDELIKLAEQGDPDAQNRVGEMYHFAEGVAQNFQEAMKWYLRASENCHPVAPNHIGRLYLNGEGVKKDPNQAAKWYLIAAERGDPFGQWNTAFAYYHGNGVKRDLKRAYVWFGLVAKNLDIVDEIWSLDGLKVTEKAKEQQQTIAKRLKKAQITRLNKEIETWRPKSCKIEKNKP